jgi:hypothetical protein
VDSRTATGVAPLRKGPEKNLSRLPLVQENGQRDQYHRDNPQNCVLAFATLLVRHVQQYTTECICASSTGRNPCLVPRRLTVSAGFPRFYREITRFFHEMPVIVDAASSAPFGRFRGPSLNVQRVAPLSAASI